MLNNDDLKFERFEKSHRDINVEGNEYREVTETNSDGARKNKELINIKSCDQMLAETREIKALENVKADILSVGNVDILPSDQIEISSSEKIETLEIPIQLSSKNQTENSLTNQIVTSSNNTIETLEEEIPNWYEYLAKERKNYKNFKDPKPPKTFAYIFQNDHDYIKEEISVKHQIIQHLNPPDTEVEELEDCTLNSNFEEEVDDFPTLYPDKMKSNENGPDQNLVQMVLSRINVQEKPNFFIFKKCLEKCVPILDQILNSNSKSTTSYIDVFKRAEELLDELSKMVAKDEYFSFAWPMSDLEDDEDAFDVKSILVNLGSVASSQLEEEKDFSFRSDYKDILILHFQEETLNERLREECPRDLQPLIDFFDKDDKFVSEDRGGIVCEQAFAEGNLDEGHLEQNLTERAEKKVYGKIDDGNSFTRVENGDAVEGKEIIKNQIEEVETKPVLIKSEPLVMHEFMGDNFELIQHVSEDDIETYVFLSSETKWRELNLEQERNVSQLYKERIKFIMDYLTNEQNTVDLIELHTMLQLKEKHSKSRLDRKSIFRIFNRLVNFGHVRALKVIMQSKDKKKFKNIVFLPNIDANKVIESTLSELKLKMVLQVKDENLEEKPLEYEKTAGIQYGYQPKFVKMQVLHEFLHYLVYDFSQEEPIQKEEVPGYLASLNINVPEEYKPSLSTIYFSKVDWRMFVNPINQTENLPRGWLRFGEALLRLPISHFVKIVNVPYKIPELMDILNHPVLKYVLVQNLPNKIKSCLLQDRRYILVIYEVLRFLCYIGLVQFGTEKSKDKDQVYLYLNRNAIYYDTTKSTPGYNQIDPDQEYTKLKFDFTVPGEAQK